MVEVIRISSQGQYPPNTMEAEMREMSSLLTSTTLSSVEEELKKDMSRKERSKDGSELYVPPRRAFTTSNYLLPTAPVSRVATPLASPRESTTDRDSYFPAPSVATLLHRLPQPAPPRSYSVMDYEPIPFTHQPGTTLQLTHLPAELHYAVFDFLDPIDSVCLALTSRHFYAVHWKMHGKVSLAARREGPNDMEWVWRHAGPFLLNRGGVGGGHNSLAMLSVRGQVYCRKCRTARCELHKHIKEWMGPGLEYCLVTEKFGPEPPASAKAFCYRSSPRHPNRCGRHTRNQRTVRLA
ncbi:hypothetical protein F5B22DRAFT_501876 [Xylaria bambusicola]|uniref:uncharacterized protein n=1 Tax=Xylaria bambusicola TaxID=326684 RepID=UPI002007CEBF|nr:uncharacterized protein F5B22DRAFT_501876 [Xylaria bambusicola]KAI0521777.1 hypothetical protein F5B22DRAFT_501876 [Xylaria bambusicola]